MSGIFAYIGREEPVNILLNGIGAMQHRGGEVNGISVKVKDGFCSAKTVGDTERLSEESRRITAQGCCGIAETSVQRRCVGAASAVPSANNLFSAACDSAIHNFSSLKRWSREPFPVNTDEDLLLACLCISNIKDRVQLAIKAAAAFSSPVGFAFMSADESAVYAHAGNTPMFVGTSESGAYLSSELAPLYTCCDKYVVLQTGETARLRTDRVLFFDMRGKKIKKSFTPMPDKVCFENQYTPEEELYSCSLSARELFTRFVKDAKLSFDLPKLTRRSVEKLSRIVLVGEGSSYFAARYCSSVLDTVTDIPSYAYLSGEFMYGKGALDKNTLLIAVSYRGETENTLSAVRRAKAAGLKTLSVTGSDTSALALMSDFVVPLGIDFVSGVQLRPFITLSMALTLLSLHIGVKDDVVTDLYLSVALKMAELISGKITAAIKDNTAFAAALNIVTSSEHIYTCGVGADYAAALEAADKMRELAALPCAAVPVAELASFGKALENSAVLAFVTGKESRGACETQLSRLRVLGARVILLTTDNIGDDMTSFDAAISVNDTLAIYNPLPCVAASYRLALMLSEAADENEKTEPQAS